ncbi:NADPH-dependent 2,4-dienoyl-CoA reductase [Rhodococcus sp. BP-149]|uniref:NADPH-dependent 2,4-dienoyl-CoA reductase n=1 Tax=unclassified Rhodococcus (in: high G+C Gram-positive bacteria) TaxID=192944 RepID=UPI001C9A5788|nr:MULTISPECIES: NADPH-dependent 2,4-dienoyl-CoA reductase [unclassified Rhodococcus (in: high G+C Gram-positive bacteria)]MBY6686269.1 NADPH-dependent 2,4-dienoyl-CoA reductase [Rhodococcus sp. BP-288]MBY6693642.1 NADPH-dependent 2,4-dienoyl-CoA reductase [Rhodococcus sp. BP-188]MBY6699761.1 NADPH-dependent 2,4-dienoyl-CoA reductase [Rhodococcus sp. BP-285]MBY6703894.1 NADPH-dependent 2,4-dienoyl-CoA reductase [Rhodococcus sp. BP-283]MBY6710958.1 NADPH-dependent 2,4-dienoyl-CoA reductase [Rho
MTDFPVLLSPITVGRTTLPNRVMMGSIHTGLEDRAKDVEKLAAYFAERARGGVGLVVTGGYSPNRTGWLLPFAAKLTNRLEARRHRRVTDAVHREGGRIVLQILHAGRYSYHPLSVSASGGKSPITPFRARGLTDRGVERQISHYVRCARLAQRAGYDGVEIMGGEGYFLNQFLAPRTNRRTDRWGGSAENRRRLPVEIVRRIRAAVGPDFLLSFRISLADLVENGQTWEEIVALATELEGAGIDLFDSDFGWHESRVPTIVTSVPRAAFIDFTRRLTEVVTVPVAAANRINMPEVAERLLADGSAHLVSLARPMLADPDWLLKARNGRRDEINTCIACNQACLDHVFVHRKASCLLNPRAGRETELVLSPTRSARTVAVVGAGPAGLATAVALGQRGHRVTLFEARDEIGGQFAIAQRIPGKEEFAETVRYFTHALAAATVDVRLGTTAGAADLVHFDRVVLATGVVPRIPSIPGIDHPSVVTYAEAVLGHRDVGRRVAVIGAGGIGVDVCEFLTTEHSSTLDTAEWRREWGVTDDPAAAGAVATAVAPPAAREVYLLQRTAGRIGTRLGKTSGWVHRAALRSRNVTQLSGVRYDRIDDDGLHITVDGRTRALEVDTIVVCAGQESVRDLLDDLTAAGTVVDVIGGADVAAEVDAKRAIEQGTRLAAAL